MAKRRKAKRTTRRRRRVGAMALNVNNPIVKFGPVLCGFLLSTQINGLVDKVAGTMDPKLVGAVQGGLGSALVFMKLGRKKTMIEVIGGGLLLGAGIKRLATSFGIMNGIGGYGKVPVIGNRRMNGYGKVPVIGNGYSPSASLNGAFNGYAVPKIPSSVMGNASGSGYSNNGSDYMG